MSQLSKGIIVGVCTAFTAGVSALAALHYGLSLGNSGSGGLGAMSFGLSTLLVFTVPQAVVAGTLAALLSSGYHPSR